MDGSKRMDIKACGQVVQLKSFRTNSLGENCEKMLMACVAREDSLSLGEIEIDQEETTLLIAS